MRRARITYPVDFHHAMNRDHDGSDIFKEIRTKPSSQSIGTQRTDDRYFDPVP